MFCSQWVRKQLWVYSTTLKRVYWSNHNFPLVVVASTTEPSLHLIWPSLRQTMTFFFFFTRVPCAVCTKNNKSLKAHASAHARTHTKATMCCTHVLHGRTRCNRPFLCLSDLQSDVDQAHVRARAAVNLVHSPLPPLCGCAPPPDGPVQRGTPSIRRTVEVEAANKAGVEKLKTPLEN